MRSIDELEHTARVHTVIEVVKEVLGYSVLTDDFIAGLQRLSFDELGQFVLRLVTTRKLEEAWAPQLPEQKSASSPLNYV
jgi:hypothetical protein